MKQTTTFFLRGSESLTSSGMGNARSQRSRAKLKEATVQAYALMLMQDPTGGGSSNALQKKLIGVHWKMIVIVKEIPEATVMALVTCIAVRSLGKTIKGKNRR